MLKKSASQFIASVVWDTKTERTATLSAHMLVWMENNFPRAPALCVCVYVCVRASMRTGNIYAKVQHHNAHNYSGVCHDRRPSTTTKVGSLMFGVARSGRAAVRHFYFWFELCKSHVSVCVCVLHVLKRETTRVASASLQSQSNANVCVGVWRTRCTMVYIVPIVRAPSKCHAAAWQRRIGGVYGW